MPLQNLKMESTALSFDVETKRGLIGFSGKANAGRFFGTARVANLPLIFVFQRTR